MNLQIENTNICQCKCTFCVRSIEPPQTPSVIDDDLYETIVRDAAKDFNIQKFYLTGLGDPFFDPKLEKRIAFAAKYFKGATICIYTNGILATKKRLEKCGKAGLTHIYFSLNAATSQMHSQIMGIEGRFGEVEKNLNDAMDIPYLDTKISAVVGSQWCEPGELSEIYEKYPGDKIYAHVAGNWMGKVYKLTYTPTRNYCRWFKEDMYVNLNGDLCHCCLDPYGKFAWGNIKKESLFNIWFNNQKRQDFLRSIEKDGRAGVIPCRGCSTI